MLWAIGAHSPRLWAVSYCSASFTSSLALCITIAVSLLSLSLDLGHPWYKHSAFLAAGRALPTTTKVTLSKTHFLTALEENHASGPISNGV